MKIVLVSYRYFISGGPERYLFNVKDILEKNGHEIIPFSIKHNLNKRNQYESYFWNAIGSGEEIYGHKYIRDLLTILKVGLRMIYSFEAKRKFKRLLRDVRPDLVYVLQYQNRLYYRAHGVPIVLFAAKIGSLKEINSR